MVIMPRPKPALELLEISYRKGANATKASRGPVVLTVRA